MGIDWYTEVDEYGTEWIVNAATGIAKAIEPIREEKKTVKYCKNCLYHRSTDIDGAFTCVNTESDYCGEYTDSHDYCIGWQARWSNLVVD